MRDKLYALRTVCWAWSNDLIISNAKQLEEKLINEKEQGFEDIVEDFLKNQVNNDRLKLKKTKFAEKLRDEMRKNFFVKKGRTQYAFEKILGNFIEKIQMRQFPKNKIDLI